MKIAAIFLLSLFVTLQVQASNPPLRIDLEGKYKFQDGVTYGFAGKFKFESMQAGVIDYKGTIYITDQTTFQKKDVVLEFQEKNGKHSVFFFFKASKTLYTFNYDIPYVLPVEKEKYPGQVDRSEMKKNIFERAISEIIFTY